MSAILPDKLARLMDFFNINSSNQLVLTDNVGNDVLTIRTPPFFSINASGIPTKSNNFSLTGMGYPMIVAAPAIQSKSNAAPTAVSYTPGGITGTYRVSYYLDITTGTTLTFIAKLTYTDPAGTARSPNLEFLTEGGTSVVAGGPAANSTGQFFGSQIFSIDNSGTPITVVDNAGTYTTGAYRWAVVLERLT